MIDKLSSYLSEASVYKDNLDFLSAIKTEVENLIRNVDKFSMGLTQDPSFFTTKNQKSAGKRKSLHGGIKKLKTEGNDLTPSPFQADTFNSKYKRHVQQAEKYLQDSTGKSTTTSKNKKRNETRDSIHEPDKKTRTKVTSKRDFIDRSAFANKSWETLKQEESNCCTKTCLEIRSDIKLLKKEQASQAIIIENMQQEMVRLRKQNEILISHMGINKKLFD